MPAVDPNCYVLADNQRLRQVILNLFSNAVKYTPLEGKVTITYESLAAGKVRLTVADTGLGIP